MSFSLNKVVFLDIETTGTDVKKEKIIEIGAVKIIDNKIEKYHTFVNPEKEVSIKIFDLCEGLKKQDLESAPTIDEIREKFLDFIEDYPLICHNAEFERMYLLEHIDNNIENHFLDSCQLACIIQPQLPSHSLDYLIKNLLKQERDEKHRALEDAEDTMEVVEALLNKVDYNLLMFILDITKNTQWHWRQIIKEVKPKDFATNTKKEIKPVKNPIPLINNRDWEEVLKEEEYWKQIIPGYVYREYQYTISKKIREVFKEGSITCLEAPAGSGKSIAYLLVAALWAKYNNEDQIIISTDTKNLQEQIIEKDLPGIYSLFNLKISDMLFTTMKGRNNYVCLSKINELITEIKKKDNNFNERLVGLYLWSWSKQSENGDMEELSYWLEKNYTYLSEIKNLIRSDIEDCEDSECKNYHGCFYKKKRSSLQNASIVVINHSLLSKWPADFPVMKRLIVDEAHNLEDKYLEGMTEEVSDIELNLLLRKCYNKEKMAVFQRLNSYYLKNSKNKDDKNKKEEIKNIVLTIEKEIKEASIAFEKMSEKYNINKSFPYRDSVKKDGEDLWGELDDKLFQLAQSIDTLAEEADQTIEAIKIIDTKFKDKALFKQSDSLIKLLKKNALIIRDSFQQADPNICYHLRYDPKSKNWELKHTPVDISIAFKDNIMEKCESAVFTSGTLANKNSFTSFEKAIGLTDYKNNRLKEGIIIDHIYDYSNNCVLGIPKDFPHYSEERFIKGIAYLAEKSANMLGGKTLVLFSSNERMKKVNDLLKEPLENVGIRLYTKGEDPGSTSKLISAFKEDKPSVLLGSRSFFEGIDIPGKALSCVIIEKVPFPFMKDPVYKKKEELDNNSFENIIYPKASIKLRQMFGRLIRSNSDKGYVIVLNQLNQEKNYMQDLINDLPPAKIRKVKTKKLVKEMEKDFERWGILLETYNKNS